jgi:hypothetical protein
MDNPSCVGKRSKRHARCFQLSRRQRGSFHACEQGLGGQMTSRVSGRYRAHMHTIATRAPMHGGRKHVTCVACSFCAAGRFLDMLLLGLLGQQCWLAPPDVQPVQEHVLGLVAALALHRPATLERMLFKQHASSSMEAWASWNPSLSD